MAQTAAETKGKSEAYTVLSLAWPAIAESFFVSLAGFIDTMMVSSLGETAVAAVGLTNQPKFLMLAPFIAMNVATSAIVARRRGEGRQDEANRTVMVLIAVVTGLSILMGALCIGVAKPLMLFVGAQADTVDDATLYYRIIMGCMIFNTLSMVINAAQRGSGNTKIAMRTNVTSSAVNICGNYLLIGGHFGFPALGIRGAAIATVAGTVVACVMCFVSLFKKGTFLSIPLWKEKRLKLSFAPMKSVVRLASSVFAEQLLIRVGFMASTMIAANLGTRPMAVHQVGMNLLGLNFSFGDGLQAAAVALIGRSLGEGDPAKAKRYAGICFRCGLVIAAALSAFFLIFGKLIYGWFFDDPELVSMGVTVMQMMVVVVLFQVPQVVFMGTLHGAGDVFVAAAIGIFSVTVVRTAVAMLCVYVLHFGLHGVWIGIIADQVCRFTLGFLRYRSGKWMSKKV